MPRTLPYGRKPSRASAQLAKAQALTARQVRPPPRLPGDDPCRGAVPRTKAGKANG
jgi:hypothetical protein